MSPKRIAVWATAGALGAAGAFVLVARLEHWRPRTIAIQGAVIRRDADPRKETPIAGAAVTVSDGIARVTTYSGATGYFMATFRERVWPAETMHVDFRAPGYEPLDMKLAIGLHNDLNKLYIAAMVPAPGARAVAAGQTTPISNIRIRYTVNYRTESNIGAAVKTFQVVNKGNVPCKYLSLCSPNGLWKASRGSVTLDAGSGSEFSNVRASCIAGPCPFTQIDSGGFTHGGQTVTASAIDWSDTATFLVEAEVFHQTIASAVRESYPVIYGRDLHFTLPPTAEGPSIEAEIGGASMVFPLGNGLYMSWATCVSRSSARSEHSAIYQCELKPGYSF